MIKIMIMKKNMMAFLFALSVVAVFSKNADAFDSKEKVQIAELKKENAILQAKLKVVTDDRDNILTQAKNFLKDKEELLKKVEEMKGGTSSAGVELESLKKENAILKSELEKIKAARMQDAKLHQEEKERIEKKLADETAKNNSLAANLKEYSPEKIQQLIEDRTRLDEENKRMSQRILDNEKQVEEMRRAMSPLQLDREELYRVQGENEELKKRTQYVGKLEGRQAQLLKENADYREQLEVLKGKFKDAVPGLAKSSRISQKMMRENADMHYNLGTIYLHNKQYAEAIKEYERVLELRPSDAETHYNLGILYDDYIKDRDKALYHYQKYLAINPKSPDAKSVESYILNLELEQKVR